MPETDCRALHVRERWTRPLSLQQQVGSWCRHLSLWKWPEGMALCDLEEVTIKLPNSMNLDSGL